jgi:hypothetical protein
LTLAVAAVRDERENAAMPPDDPGALFRQVGQMVWGPLLAQALRAAAILRIFDLVHAGAKTAGELAAASGAHEASLRRVLRFLTTADVLREDEHGRFSATELGDMLRSDHPQSMRTLAILVGGPAYWNAWGDLAETVRTGAPAFDRVHGESFFAYLGNHPDVAALFDATMTSLSAIDLPFVLDAYDFARFTTIVDVGGGRGALLRGILERHPHARGILCDVAAVLAANVIGSSSVGARCEVVPIDMFESVPSGGDAYLLKRILHDWNDAEAGRILRNCRRAMAAHGTLLVIDSVVSPPNQPDPAKWMDLNMMVLLTGRERTAEDFGELFASAGFRVSRIVPAGRVSIVEGAPA